MATQASWIKSELRKQFPHANLRFGIDLNRNHRIEPNERMVDANKNGFIGDDADLVAFYKLNHKKLAPLGGMFAQAWRLRADNPIHDILHVELSLAKTVEEKRAAAQNIEATHRMISLITKEVQKRLRLHRQRGAAIAVRKPVASPAAPGKVPSAQPPKPAWQPLTDKQRLAIVFEEIAKYNPLQRQRAARQPKPLTVDAFRTKRLTQRMIDKMFEDIIRKPEARIKRLPIALPKRLLMGAVTPGAFSARVANLIAFAVSHQLSWPVKLVTVSDKVFVRWQKAGSTFNMDQGTIKTDEMYVRELGLSGCAVGGCSYLKSLTRKGVLSFAKALVSGKHLKNGREAKALLAAQSAVALDPTNPQAFFARGAAQMELAEFAKARASFDLAIMLDPYHHPALAARAELDFDAGMTASAMKHIESAISRKMKGTYLYLRSRIHFKLKKVYLSFRDLNMALRADPTIAKAYVERAKMFFAQGDLPRALADFQSAVSLGVADPMIQVFIGRLKLSLKDDTGAVRAFNKAIEAGVKTPFTYFGRGAAYAALGKREQAVADLSRSTRLGFIAYFTRGRIYALMGKYTKALADFKDALSYGRDKHMVLIERGRVYAAMKKFKLARADFAKALKVGGAKGGVAGAYIGRGIVFAAQKQYAKAIKEYERAMEVEPRSGEAYYRRGLVHAARGKHRRALIDYLVVPLMKYKASELPYHKAISLIALGKHAKALTALNAFIESNKQHAGALHQRGRVQELLYRIWPAMDDYNAAIRLDGKQAAFYVTRGKLFTSIGEHEKAIVDFTKAIGLDPKGAARYRILRGDAQASLGRFAPARRDYRASHRAMPKLNARARTRRLSLVPEVSFDAQVRYGLSKPGRAEGRTGINATWYLANLHRNLNLGLRLGLGYAGAPDRDIVDLGASLALINRFKRSNLSAEVGAGYSFLLGQGGRRAAVPGGGFFRYGLRYTYFPSDVLGIGASLQLQHSTDDPTDVAIVPGFDVSLNFW